MLTAEFRATAGRSRASRPPPTRSAPSAACRQRSSRRCSTRLIDAYANGEEAGDPDETDWIEGNLDGIAAEMDSLPPELFETLVTRRNRHFADWLAARLDRPGTVLFAIGAGHLAGRVSVQSMLQSRGLRVTRLN